MLWLIIMKKLLLIKKIFKTIIIIVLLIGFYVLIINNLSILKYKKIIANCDYIVCDGMMKGTGSYKISSNNKDIIVNFFFRIQMAQK